VVLRGGRASVPNWDLVVASRDERVRLNRNPFQKGSIVGCADVAWTAVLVAL
jgi:hypothetical protein